MRRRHLMKSRRRDLFEGGARAVGVALGTNIDYVIIIVTEILIYVKYFLSIINKIMSRYWFYNYDVF